MKIELILLGVIGSVFLVDFLMKGFKNKKNIDGDLELIGNNEKDKKIKGISYFLNRKKNISLLIIFIPFFKVFLHYLLYPIKTKRLTGKVAMPNLPTDRRRRKYGNGLSNTYEEVSDTLGTHFNEAFNIELWLFIPAIILTLIIVWIFNDKIKAR